MKISFSTLGCPHWSWREITSAAVDLNYQGIEMRGIGTDISVPVIPVFSENNIDHTISELKRMNLVIPCLDSDCCIHLSDSEAPVDIEVEAYLKLAKKLSTPYVRIMAAAPVPKPVGTVDEGYVREHAAKLGGIAEQYGVTLLIETNGVWSDTEKLARLLEAIDSKFVKALWDVHHPYRFKGESPQVTAGNLRPWLCHTHFKDSQKTADGYRYALPGFGDVPLEGAVHALDAIGYDGFYSLEWVKRWDTTLEEPGIVFAHYANYMRTFA
ncbi:MAG TPA: sugar phosphate isomerase/epimerase family protein [Candidatus Limiplasma sp.]|nr:sugar phosphate isomerase/epimerase family protein [Candidatus Limiplasma sp.]